MPRAHPALLALLLLACGGEQAPADAGHDAGRDAGQTRDAGRDSGTCHLPRDGAAPSLPDAGPAAALPELDCGAPSFPEGTGLRRRPYLQSITGTSARIAWTTTTMGASGSVRFAASPDGPFTEIAAGSELFEVSRTVDEPEDFVAFDATLTGLEPNRAYCYEVLEDGVPIATGLRLDTAWEGSERPVRLLAFGDSGSGSAEQLAVRDRFLERLDQFDLFLHLGDLAYGSGTFAQFHERVFRVYEDALHRIPTWPTIGNHEYATESGQPYLDVFYLPEQALRERDQERYYSFDYGNVHFVSLDSNSPQLIPIITDVRGRSTDDMVDWLRADLASSDAEWKIAFFHHTPFSSSSRGINREVVLALLPVLEEGGVDLVLAGHDHHYERTLPIFGECLRPAGDPGAITYVTAGAGGAGLRPATGDWFTATVESELHSFLTLTIHGCVAHGEAIDLEGRVIDTFDLNGCD